MIHEQNVEYRHLNILRVKMLRELQENKGIISLQKFRTMLKSIMRNVTQILEDLFIEIISNEYGYIDYQKLCEVINLYQYHLFFVKYFV